MPPPLPLNRIRQYRDPRIAVPVAFLLPGSVYVTRRPEVLSTILGSCVAVCLYAPEKRMAGMNHYLLPGRDRPHSFDSGECLRYGSGSLPVLLERMRARGADPQRLRAKVFGGGRVIAGLRAGVGEANVQIALQFLQAEGVEIAALDVGGSRGRKLMFDSRTGMVHVLKLRDRIVPASEEGEIQLSAEVAENPLADVRASDLIDGV